MSLKVRREYLKAIWERYQGSTRREKSVILGEFTKNCGYSRSYATWLLGKPLRRLLKRRGPKRRYDQEFQRVLLELWLATHRICSKKLVKAIPLWLPYCRESFKITAEVEEKLLSVSAATIDRLLKRTKKKYQMKGISTTKAGSFVKQKIPLRIAFEEVKEPGYVQVDTVAHCGASVGGAYGNSLTMVDLHILWTVSRAVWTKNSNLILNELKKIEAKIPFPLKGYSSDNGTEVLNRGIYDYLVTHRKPESQIQVTRSRAYRKNDNAHVEQRNNSHVRELFGYDRVSHPALIKLMNEIYEHYWDPLQNYFTPAMKLKDKIRFGGRIVKKHDDPRTPYQRLMDCPMVAESVKLRATKEHAELNPLELSRGLEKKLKRYFRLVREKQLY